MLGIEAGPTGVPDEEIVASAFKKLAMRWHPDRNPDNVKEATQRFAEISAARDLLVDPPTNALMDEPSARGGGAAGGSASDPYPKSGPNLRSFEGDVTEQVESGTLSGTEAVALFESFGLWAVWKCNGCNAVCCRIRKNKYSCMCSHRLRDHDAGRGFRCADLKCPCKRYRFQVQDTDQPHKCRCKHKPAEHNPLPPHECTKCSDCVAFDSPWTWCMLRQMRGLLPNCSTECSIGGGEPSLPCWTWSVANAPARASTPRPCLPHAPLALPPSPWTSTCRPDVRLPPRVLSAATAPTDRASTARASSSRRSRNGRESGSPEV